MTSMLLGETRRLRRTCCRLRPDGHIADAALGVGIRVDEQEEKADNASNRGSATE